MGIINNPVAITFMVIVAILFISSLALLGAMQYRELKVSYWTPLKTIFRSKAFYRWFASVPLCKHKELNHFNKCKNCGSYIKPRKRG